MIRLLLDLSFYSIVTVLILIAFICAITTDKLGQQVTTAMALVILAPLYVVYQIVRLGMVDEPARPRSSSVTLSRPLDKVFVFEQSAETLTRSLIQQVRTYEDQSFDLCVSSGCSRKFQVQVLPKQKNASVNFTLDCEVVPLSDGSEAISSPRCALTTAL